MFTHILVPTDGSELSRAAVEKAIAFAKETGARLTFFHAMPEAPYPVSSFGEEARYEPEKAERFSEAAQRHARSLVNAALDAAKQAGVEADVALAASDSPYQAIIQAAQERGCDLIFMASHGRRGINALVLGSETNKVLTHCTIPVLVYR